VFYNQYQNERLSCKTKNRKGVLPTDWSSLCLLKHQLLFSCTSFSKRNPSHMHTGDGATMITNLKISQISVPTISHVNTAITCVQCYTRPAHVLMLNTTKIIYFSFHWKIEQENIYPCSFCSASTKPIKSLIWVLSSSTEIFSSSVSPLSWMSPGKKLSITELGLWDEDGIGGLNADGWKKWISRKLRNEIILTTYSTQVVLLWELHAHKFPSFSTQKVKNHVQFKGTTVVYKTQLFYTSLY